MKPVQPAPNSLLLNESLSTLTTREWKLLIHLASDLTPAELAESLSVTPKNVQNHTNQEGSTSTRFLKTIHLSLLLVAFCAINAFAQTRQPVEIDSLLEQGKIRSRTQSFYIKPIVEQYQSLVSVEGAGFSSPNGDLLR